MGRLLLILVFVFLMADVFAICEEGQININSASLEEMMKITGLGGTGITAKNVIASRPFSSLDDLTRVSGIKEGKLALIKQQGLACVDEEIENSEDNFEENDSAEEETEEVEIEDYVEETGNLIYENFSQETSEEELSPISLNSKSIKSEDNNDNLKRNLALGGIVTFCVIFGALFFLKTRRRKNEFQ